MTLMYYYLIHLIEKITGRILLNDLLSLFYVIKVVASWICMMIVGEKFVTFYTSDPAYSWLSGSVSELPLSPQLLVFPHSKLCVSMLLVINDASTFL